MSSLPSLSAVSPKLALSSAALTLAAKGGKLEADQKAIGAGMAEAGEKADRAMNAAWTGMVTGIASGLASVAGAAASFSGQVLRGGALKNTLLDHFNFATAPQGKQSDKVQKKIAEAEAAANASKNASQSGETDSAGDRRKAGLDNIQKLLDLIRSINPQI